ncbi:MAG: NAD-binding protein [Burkholderiales bacterium]|nr:NAD-binding protein [Burkholderiales bacterium]MDE1928827.1 NAD-binding protein [Burkholderiales bacterium]MDE2159290.1 NAD-binding protein [Burkholderiales bacterium]MDE2502547.1 NAD-binding protein [Burkholderiales bacterium]
MKLPSLKRSTRRLIALLSLLPVTVLLLGSTYAYLMGHIEGRPRTLLQGLQWASETLTTTGYGADNHWSRPTVAIFVIVAQFLGLFFVLLFIPVFVLPYFEERFEVRLPKALPPMQGRVLFYRYGPAIESLLEEFHRDGRPFVIFEEDAALARKLRDRGFEVVHSQLADDPAALAGVADALAVVSNASDYANAACTFAARDQGYAGALYVLAAEPLYRAPMLRIGATDVFTPAHVLGAALASRASGRISPPAEGMQLIGNAVGMAELRVRADSPLAGRRLGELRMRERYGVSVIGQWRAGRFSAAAGPQTVIEAGAIVVAVGAHAQLERLERLALPLRRDGAIVLAGYGSVGAKVVELLRDAGERTVVIDQRAGAGVDIVGNVLERATLERAGVREASAVILALADDSESVFATAAVREYAAEVPLVVRVLRAPNTTRLYASGADFAISLGQVTGQILAYHLLDQQVLSVETAVKFIRVGPGRLVGAHPWHVEALDRTGAKVVAVERGSEVAVEFDAAFRVDAGDALIVCGSIDSLERYQREFQVQVRHPA